MYVTYVMLRIWLIISAVKQADQSGTGSIALREPRIYQNVTDRVVELRELQFSCVFTTISENV